jgi:hypothetical protein
MLIGSRPQPGRLAFRDISAVDIGEARLILVSAMYV